MTKRSTCKRIQTLRRASPGGEGSDEDKLSKVLPLWQLQQEIQRDSAVVHILHVKDEGHLLIKVSLKPNWHSEFYTNCVCLYVFSDISVRSPCRRRTHRGIWRVTRWSPRARAWSKRWRRSVRHQTATSCRLHRLPRCPEDLPLPEEVCVLLLCVFSINVKRKVAPVAGFGHLQTGNDGRHCIFTLISCD